MGDGRVIDMTEVQELANFITKCRYEDLSEEARQHLKIRILDGLGCAIGALHADPIEKIRSYVKELGGNPLVHLIGGGLSSPDRAAFFNCALVRYLDFNDSYLAKGETCHPSDNLGAILAAAEYANADGKTVLTALAISYQVQCRLSDEAPVRHKGFDHTTQSAYGVAAGVAKAMGLDQEKTAHAIAISGTCNVALRVTRTGALSHWKGLASPNTAFIGTHAAFLAYHGITGPLEVFEGNKGFKALAGPFQIDWKREDLEIVRKTSLKKYNAEIHSQSAIEGTLDLQARHAFKGHEVERADIEIFDVAYHIIGGGEEGDRLQVTTKEEADHSLHYLIAVALLDGQVLPAQYDPARIKQDDVQKLLHNVHIKPNREYTIAFPDQMQCSITITLKDGRTLQIHKNDYEGFFTRPFDWHAVLKKFTSLTNPFISAKLQAQIAHTVETLDTLNIKDLTNLFSTINKETKS
jgi:2-methylcitrate dehydratase